MSLALALDLLFIGLLAATLFYMARLNRRLDALRAGRQEFEALLQRFSAATEQAQANIGGMKAAAEGTGKDLQEEIEKARSLREDLAFLAERASRLADELELAISRSRATANPAAQPAPANVARMPSRQEPHGGAGANAPVGGPVPLSSGANELLRRLSALR